MIQRQHYHDVGTYKIVGSVTSKDETNQQYKEYFTTADKFTNSGALSITDKVTNGMGVQLTGHMDAAAYRTMKLEADSQHGFSGNSGEARRADNGKKFDDTIGEGIAHNNMPPYTVGVLWHRTA